MKFRGNHQFWWRLTIAVALACANEARTQEEGWIRVSSPKTIAAFNGMHFLNRDTGFAVGDNGALLKTFTGGRLWDWQFALGLKVGALRSIKFPSPSVGYAVGDSGAVFKTDDAGETWKILPTGFRGTLRAISMVEDGIGFAAGDSGTILKTIDGGKSWTRHGNAFKLSLLGIHFTDKNTGFAVGVDGKILRTVDEGATWTSPVAGTNMDLAAITMITKNLGYAVGEKGTCIRTEDGGATWSAVATGSQEDFKDIRFLDAENGYIAGGGRISGTVLKSSDGGITWMGSIIPEFEYNRPKTFNCVAVVDDHFLYAAGLGPYGLIKSEDAGSKWAYVQSMNFNSVKFLDSKVGYAVGNTGYISGLFALGVGSVFKTVDGGQIWTETVIDSSGTMNSVQFPSADVGYALGGGVNSFARPAFIKTVDAGKSWKRIKVPFGSWQGLGVWFTDEKSGIIPTGSFPGVFYRTSDGGETWSSAQNYRDKDSVILSIAAKSIAFTESDVGFCIGDNGQILKTEDAGRIWEIRPSGTTMALNEIWFQDESVGYIAGNQGTLLKTSDGGTTWNALLTNTVFDLRSVRFVGKDTGYAVGKGVLLKTTNGGEKWVAQFSGLFPELSSVAMLDANTIITVGDGYMIRTRNGGVPPIPIRKATKVRTRPFRLEGEGVRYSLDSHAHVRIRLIDVQGRTAGTLFDGIQAAGEHTQKIPYSELGLGAFFLDLSINGKTHYLKTGMRL